MNTLQRLLSLTLIALMAASYGCGTGTRQSPVAADSLEAGEEVGELTQEEDDGYEDAGYADEDQEEEPRAVAPAKAPVRDFDAVEARSMSDRYTVRAGDTLASIAAKEEIYGDGRLWPILQEANRAVLGQGAGVNAGVTLKIPRRLTSEEMEEAREKARQAQAAADSPRREISSRPMDGEEVPVEPEAAEGMDAADGGVEAQAAPQPVPKPKKKGVLLPVLIVIFVVLLLAAVILLYFMKKDNDEEEV